MTVEPVRSCPQLISLLSYVGHSHVFLFPEQRAEEDEPLFIVIVVFPVPLNAAKAGYDGVIHFPFSPGPQACAHEQRVAPLIPVLLHKVVEVASHQFQSIDSRLDDVLSLLKLRGSTIDCVSKYGSDCI